MNSHALKRARMKCKRPSLWTESYLLAAMFEFSFIKKSIFFWLYSPQADNVPSLTVTVSILCIARHIKLVINWFQL